MRLNIVETALEIGFVEQFEDATINLKPIGFLCILGIQYMMGKVELTPCTFSPKMFIV